MKVIKKFTKINIKSYTKLMKPKHKDSYVFIPKEFVHEYKPKDMIEITKFPDGYMIETTHEFSKTVDIGKFLESKKNTSQNSEKNKIDSEKKEPLDTKTENQDHSNEKKNEKEEKHEKKPMDFKNKDDLKMDKKEKKSMESHSKTEPEKKEHHKMNSEKCTPKKSHENPTSF
jgi:hypothetical protein